VGEEGAVWSDQAVGASYPAYWNRKNAFCGPWDNMAFWTFLADIAVVPARSKRHGGWHGLQYLPALFSTSLRHEIVASSCLGTTSAYAW